MGGPVGGGGRGGLGGLLKLSMETRKNHKENPSLVGNVPLLRKERSMPENFRHGCRKFPVIFRLKLLYSNLVF
jgi:hypothetical protein